MKESQFATRDEPAIIKLILAGNTQLYHELIRPYERSVYMMALSLLRNEADAEDVAQEAFLKAFDKLGSFRFESKFSTWLISITLNEARGRLRRNGLVRAESLDEPPSLDRAAQPALLIDWREVPLAAIERLEVRGMLEEAVTSLPTIYKQVFVLRDIEEFDIATTAEMLGLTAANVKVRLHRARMMLQKRLAPQLKAIAPGLKRRWLPWF